MEEKQTVIIKIAATGLAMLGFLQLARAFTALFSPIVLDYCEMIVAGAAEQLRLSGNLAHTYAPPAAPYGMPGMQYPPLFIALVAGLVELSGLGPVLAERLLAWGFYAGAGGLVGLIVWQETRQRWAALVAAGLPFCFWSVIIFAHAARVDPLALFLSLLAAYLYRRFTLNRSTAPTLPQLTLIAFIAVLAFFSKQTYLAVSAAIFIHLLMQKLITRTPGHQDTRSITFISVYLCSSVAKFVFLWLMWVALGFALVGWLSGGAYFGIFEPARAGSFIFHLVPGFVGFFLLDHLPFLLIAAFSLRWQWRNRERFWPLYTLFAALACVTIVKNGAVDYYFNELAYVLSVSLGLALSVESRTHRATLRAEQEVESLITKTPGHHDTNNPKSPAPEGGKITRPRMGKNPKWIAVAFSIQVIIALAMFVGWSHWKDFESSERAYREGLALVRTAQAQQAQGGKEALVLVDSFLLETGRAEQVADYFIYAVLLGNGARNAQPLLTDLENGRYSLIITEIFLPWPKEVELAFASRYNRRSIYGDDGRELYRAYTLRT